MKRSLTYSFVTTLLTLVLSFTISCGGGGGGGGGTVGPAAASETTSDNEPKVSAPVKSSAAEVISFKFEQAKNAPALSALSSDLEGNLSNNQEITVNYNYGTLNEQPALKPSIKVSSGATIKENTFTQTEENGEKIWTTKDPTDFFANPVSFTVKAENGTEKAWSVTLNQMEPGEYRIIYKPEGIIDNPYPTTYNESQSIQFNENPNKVTVNNYYFDGWYEDAARTTSPVTGWNSMERTGDVTLYAKLQPAPYADLASKKIFANGVPVTVKNNDGTTMVYFDVNGAEKSLFDLNEHYNADFTDFDLYAGTSGDANAANINDSAYVNYPHDINSGNITITSGKLNNIYGGTGTNPKTPLLGGSNIFLSGNPTVGNKKDNGIWLESFTGNKAKIIACVSSTDNKITLIAAPSATGGTQITEGNPTSKESYTLKNNSCSATLELENNGNNLRVKASVILPDPENVKWSKDKDYFTLGSGNVLSNGTILSIGVENGYFTVPSATVTGGEFDMAIEYSDASQNKYLDKSTGLSTSKKLKYVQFISEAGEITADNASNFLAKVKFFIKPGESKIKIKLNLQTVPLATITNAGVTYFNGSFYKIESTDKSWTDSLAAAQASTFNGLSGYLMTITSQIENMFIYDRVFKKHGINQTNARGWIGAKKVGDKWQWACGPENGKTFYNMSKYNDSKTDYTVNPTIGEDIEFAAWDNFIDRKRNGTWTNHVKDNPWPGLDDNGKPKYTGSTSAVEKYSKAAAYADDAVFWPAEKPQNWYINWNNPDGSYAFYSGIYAWMAGANNVTSNKKPLYYIVEYTAYTGTGGTPDAPVLVAEQLYTRP